MGQGGETQLALTPMSVSARLEVDWSRNFAYIARKLSVKDDRQTDNGVHRAAKSQPKTPETIRVILGLLKVMTLHTHGYI